MFVTSPYNRHCDVAALNIFWHEDLVSVANIDKDDITSEILEALMFQ